MKVCGCITKKSQSSVQPFQVVYEGMKIIRYDNLMIWELAIFQQEGSGDEVDVDLSWGYTHGAYRNYVTFKPLPFDSSILSKELVKVLNDRQALVVHAVYKSRMTGRSMQDLMRHESAYKDWWWLVPSVVDDGIL